jgi:hypothetical protein
MRLIYTFSEVNIIMDLKKYIPNTKANVALIVGAILAIMIGSVLLVVSYTVINAVVVATGTVSNPTLNSSLFSNYQNIVAALNISGIALIIVGIAGVIYQLISLGGISGGRP